MSWLGYLNFIVFQWFFVRLARYIDIETRKTVRWEFMGPIVPLTGWWSEYKWLK